ncbi:sec-independent protein translocase protein TatB [Neorhizobium sp. R1-B]|jgi:sec-independent protein translocase protein TatB|uniref:Sec-independent protein translocase protein TatB n=1 Tax=Neorhizobium TaxID=1525371 RepID=UPI000CFA5944|nr:MULTISPECIES: Sec-independent protein translocase protein TatB [Neorhizobium]TCV60864.1 sec-independent protein translocase protein TatB [Neorhizobium sp. S3-V5DH]TDX73850.1 sec-independent protein translocase protein TatB [Neorhizobium sp. R1-B]
MLDIGWTELLVIAIVLIVVVGPKDLPPMLRAFGKMTANLRKMAGDFRTQFDEALRESELDDVRKTISDAQRLNPSNALRDAINPLRQMGEEIRADLQKTTHVPTPDVVPTDIEARQAVEGVTTGEAAAEAKNAANVSAPSLTLPSTAPPVSAPLSGPDRPPSAAAGSPAEKPKPSRKTAAKTKPAAAPEPSAGAAEKPQRGRAAKPAPRVAEEVAAKAPARRRAAKKTDTPKGDA